MNDFIINILADNLLRRSHLTGEKPAPEKGKGLGRHAALPLCTESSVPLSSPTCKDVMGTTLYVWCFFWFFFCIRIKQFYVSLKKKLWIRWSKIVVICFEVIISILLLSLCLQLTWMLLFCRSYVNIKTWKCNHVCYQQWVVTQALHPTESFTFLISRKLPTFYFFCLYFSGFCFFFFFFQTQGFLQ